MKVAIITTVNHNVGDDFVREGIKFLIKKKFNTNQLSFENVHKHSPITTRYGFEWFRNLRYSSRVDKFLPVNWTKDRILDADLVIQSGAPAYWCHNVDSSHCCDNEWYSPLIRKRYINNKKARLINLAVGTCQTYNSTGEEFCENCLAYIKDFYNRCQTTTVRDSLSKAILNRIGLNVPVIPCSSIFAIDEHGFKNEGEEYVVVNYMKGGSHYTFGQSIDFNKWQSEFKKFYFELKQKERVIFSCHNQKEVDEAKEIDPDAEIFYQNHDYLAYMKFYAKAKFGIMNRVHGAFLMASLGKPSVVIGNDSRAKMVSEIGLESFFVNDADYQLLNAQYEFLKSGANDFAERFQKIKANAFNDYMQALSVL